MNKLFVSFALVLINSLVVTSSFAQQNVSLQGAYNLKGNQAEETIIFQDGYFMHAVYDLANKKFQYSEGGTFEVKGDSLIQNIEFSTQSPDNVGIKHGFRMVKTENDITLTGKSMANQIWKKLDDGTGGLAGNWRITGRKQGDSVSRMQRGARKTMKILSGSRFQWAAINPATKEFFGTGGGTYTFKDGKYTENIEFFSRDNSRVGASLGFNGEVRDGEWHHSGNSSTGSPIYEIWTREK